MEHKRETFEEMDARIKKEMLAEELEEHVETDDERDQRQAALYKAGGRTKGLLRSRREQE